MSNVKFSLILANVVPLILVLTGQLDVAQTLVLYWLETVVMGLITVVCILFAEGARNPLSQRMMDIAEGSRRYSRETESWQGRSGLGGCIFTAVFFAGKGGMSLALSGVFIFGYILPGLPGFDLTFSNAMLDLLLGWNPKPGTNYFPMLKPLIIPLSALTAGHIWSFARDFWHEGQGGFFSSDFYSGVGLLRVLAVLLTTIFAGFISRFAGAAAGVYVVAVLVLVKTVFDHQIYAVNTAFPDGDGGVEDSGGK